MSGLYFNHTHLQQAKRMVNKYPRSVFILKAAEKLHVAPSSLCPIEELDEDLNDDITVTENLMQSQSAPDKEFPNQSQNYKFDDVLLDSVVVHDEDPRVATNAGSTMSVDIISGPPTPPTLEQQIWDQIHSLAYRLKNVF